MYSVKLTEKEIPKKWYNIAADLPVEFPAYDQTEEGKQLENLPKIFSKGVLEQELSTERYIKIPKEVRNLYKQMGRPSPLVRAKALEDHLDTPPKYSTKGKTLHPLEVTN